MEERDLTWRRSSRSGSGNGGGDNCVEVATSPGEVWVRDSKAGDRSPTLRVSHAEWATFLRSLSV